MDARTTLRRGSAAALVALGLVLGAAAAPAAAAPAAGAAGASQTGQSEAGPCAPVSVSGMKATPAVRADLDRLAAAGAVPVLRVWQDVPGGDLDAAVQTVVDGCESWRGAGLRGVASSVVVLAVSLDDRRSGVYYGDQFKPFLDSWWEGMLLEVVNPLLEKGKTAAAVDAGLAALATQVDMTQPGDTSDGALDGSDTSGMSGPSDAGGGQGGVDTGLDPSADCPDCVGDPAFGGGFGGDGFGGSSGSGVAAVVAFGVVGLVVTGALAAVGIGAGRRRTTGSTFVGMNQDPTWMAGTTHHSSFDTDNGSTFGGSSFGGFDSGGSSGSSDSGSSGGDMGGGSTSW